METLERLFQLKERGTNVKTEVVAGLTTFLAMAYILAVNPSILGTVMDANGVFVATALASALATFLMAFIANYPIALSAGLGLNAYFAFTVCLGELKDVPDPWTIALTAVFVEGCIFVLMSFFKFREKIVNGIPQNLKLGITAGIGLFITIIALKGAGIVVADESTLLGLGSFASPDVVLCLVGFMVIVVLTHYQITGAIMIGILITWALGMVAQLTGWWEGASMFPSFAEGLHLDAIKNTAFHLNFSWAGQHLVEFLAIVLSFLYVDLFDTVGTVVGVADKAGLLDKDGNLPRAGAVLMSDALGTTAGALLGTSTVTSFVESSAGVAAGGKTGLTSATTGTMFLVALFLGPIFLAIPTFATSAALLYVGMLMMSSVTKMKFDGDVADSVGGFMAVAMMPLTYSIANGIMFGIMSWVILKVCTGKSKEVSPIMWIIFVLFALRIVTLVTNFM